jgi:uncharacterized membrane protein YdjX (TVP38/TMEM64 family)
MDSRRPAFRRIAIYAAVVGAAFAAALATGSIPSSDEARDFVDGLGPLAPLLYVPLFVAANFLITWPILAGAGGLLFGTAAGTPLALIGVTLAALAQMAVARRLAGEHKGNLLPQRTKRVENFLTEHGGVAVMQSRIVPLLPYGVVNYSAGLTHLTFTAMAAGTVLGAAPKVFAYVALGGSLSDLTSPEALVAIALLFVLAIGGALFVRQKLRAASAQYPRAAHRVQRQEHTGHQYDIAKGEHVGGRPRGGDGEDVAEEAQTSVVDDV